MIKGKNSDTDITKLEMLLMPNAVPTNFDSTLVNVDNQVLENKINSVPISEVVEEGKSATIIKGSHTKIPSILEEHMSTQISSSTIVNRDEQKKKAGKRVTLPDHTYFLQTDKNIKKRKALYISCEVHETLQEIIRWLAPSREFGAVDYAHNIFLLHLEQYREELKQLIELKRHEKKQTLL